MEYRKLGSYSQFRTRIRWVIAVGLCIVGSLVLAIMAFLTLNAEQYLIGVMDLLFVSMTGGCLIYLMRGDRANSSRLFFLLTSLVLAMLPVLSVLQGKSFHYWFYLFPLCVMFINNFTTATWLSLGFGVYATALVAPIMDPIDAMRVALSYLVCTCFAMTYAFLEGRAIEMLEFYSHHDPLSNCLNRRTFNEHLEAVANESADGPGVCVLLIDVDHFKKVNDQHGHLIGDRVITEIALVMNRHLDATTPLYRYGGEEFVILLMDAEPEAGKVLAERIRSMVMCHLFCEDLRLTISVGVSHWEAGDISLEKTVDAADTALYQAKNEGRNQVRIAA